MDYSTIKSIFVDLGFTPDKITPLFVVLVIGIILIDRRMKPVEVLSKKIEGFIIRLCGAIESGGKIENVTLYSNDSPLKITPKGMEILEKIGFKKAIDDNLDVSLKTVDGLGSKSALDVETVCIGIIRYWITDQRDNTFKDVKDFIYNNPTYNDPEYFKLAGLYLRDKYLEQHPELLPPKVNL